MASVVVVVALTPFYINLQLLQTATTPDGTISSLPPPTATGNHIDIVTPSFDDKSKDIAYFINAAKEPIPIYTEQLAIEAIRPSSWHCSPESEPSYSKNHTVFAFIHVYKTAGTTLRKFFHEYAYTCHKTWISLATCTNVEALSIISGERWKPCQIEEVANGRKQKKEQYNHPKLKNFVHPRLATYKKVDNKFMENDIDIYGGHVRIGTGDSMFPSSLEQRVRYIVFLRDPKERFVSGVLYQNKVKNKVHTLEQIVARVKEEVINNRAQDKYWDKSLSYLLTPKQMVENDHLNVGKLRSSVVTTMNTAQSDSSFVAETRAKLAIHNLRTFNTIIGMTENMHESMSILKQVFLHDHSASLNDAGQKVFAKYTPIKEIMLHDNSTSVKGGVQANKSVKGEVSTDSVIEELATDKRFTPIFEEYVKYEQMITDYAWKMHNLQYRAAVGNER